MKVPTSVLHVPLVGLSSYTRRIGRRHDWPSCAACSKLANRPVAMYSVERVDLGPRHVTILGRCRIHGEQALRVDFERRIRDSDVQMVWRQLVFHEGELAR